MNTNILKAHVVKFLLLSPTGYTGCVKDNICSVFILETLSDIASSSARSMNKLKATTLLPCLSTLQSVYVVNLTEKFDDEPANKKFCSGRFHENIYMIVYINFF